MTSRQPAAEVSRSQPATFDLPHWGRAREASVLFLQTPGAGAQLLVLGGTGWAGAGVLAKKASESL